LIETEQQRRWWFATHPEFSSKGSGKKSKRHKDEGEPEKISPEAVDAYVDKRLAEETDPVIIQLLKSTKYWFGTESELRSPSERQALLWGDEESFGEDEPVGELSADLVFVQPSRLPAHLTEPRDPVDAYAKWLTERRGQQLEADPHTLLDLFPYRKIVTAPIQVFRNLLKNMAEGAVVKAAKKASEGGPGKWVEVARSPLGLEHQSKMSGQPIRVRDGKHHINEYDLNGVKFDDYRDGKLYEYKGKMGNLITKKTGEFYPSCDVVRKAQDEAQGQARAAKGIPVIWRVGENQVKAFKNAIGDLPGIFIEP